MTSRNRAFGIGRWVLGVRAFRRSGVQAHSLNLNPNLNLNRLSLLFAATSILGIQVPIYAQQTLQGRTPGEILFDQFREIIRAGNFFKSPGPVRIEITDAVTGEKTIFYADDAEGTIGGDIFVRGAVRLEDAQGTMSGRNLRMNMADETGTILEARVTAPGLRVGGAKVELLPGRILKATNATFTTCEKEERPDYKITAREIEVNVPKRKIKARNVTFYLGNTRIISLPFLERSFNRKQGSPLPLPGYSNSQGVHGRFRSELISNSSTSLEYNVLLGLKGNPEGTLAYERDLGRTTEEDDPPRTRVETALTPMKTAFEITPPPTLKSLGDSPERKRRTTLFGLLAVNNVVYNRKRGDLRVSRLPEIGVQVANLTNRPLDADEQPGVLGDLTNPRKWLVNAEASAGFYHERPTGVNAFRTGMRADASSTLIPLGGPLYGRAGFTGWANAYSKGGPHVLLAPEVEANYFLQKDRLIGIGFRHTLAIGDTPFVFDSRDVVNALSVRYAYAGSRWAYDLAVHFDAGRRRAYDTTARLLKRTDCLEYGIGYSARSQSFNLVLNLLPAGAARPMAKRN